MAKLEEMKVGEVYRDVFDVNRKIVFADQHSALATVDFNDNDYRSRTMWTRSLVINWTLVKPERELWHWRVKPSRWWAWHSPDCLMCDEGLDSNGAQSFKNWHSLEKEKLTALGSVKVEG